ncbi:MAG: LysR family transcriptional regulator [Desulfobacter sp.]|nr:LysR family transcriptional regulator [Desulfobacter sp.]WDP85291.1 MAG: LysR family transcriptional regulator [Desulfobacter sp.]
MIPIDLDINMLRCFKQVAETKSFTRAGNNIGLTQAGVSTKIRRLEERLDAKVFNRTSKNLSLTHVGETLLAHAQRILSAHDEAVSQLTAPKASGLLRVGLIDYVLPELLPGILSQFKKRYPNIYLEVQMDLGTGLIPAFKKGDLDLVVAGKDMYQGSCRVLVQEPLVWTIGKGMEFDIDDTLPLVVLPSPCHFRKLATQTLEQENRKWKIVFTGTSISSIQTAVQAGMGLSVLPMGALKQGLIKAPSKLELPELPMFSIAVFTDKNKQNNARDVFISYLEAEISNQKRA